MIVTCERCETEFQLDDSRVPESGARVRCSRCKHAFMVTRPAADQGPPPAEEPSEALFDRAAQRALDVSETPDITQDLAEEPEPERESVPEPAQAQAEADESDWQFNADLPAESVELQSDRRRAPAPVSAPAEELGSPSEWDIFDDVATPAAAAASAAPAPRASVPRRVYLPGYESDAVETGDEPPSPAVQRAVSAVGWLATAGLFAIALWHGITPGAPAETVWPALAPGVALEGVRARWLENLYLGRLYVVSGQLRNESASAFVALPALELELRDGSGGALAQRYSVAAPLAPGRLRDADPAELAGAPGIGSSLRGGETRAFEIVVWPLPVEAERFAIRAATPSS